MNHVELQLHGVGDPRLAVHATSTSPAWLWSIDGTRVLWANPVGARLFGAANGAALARKTFGPADPHRRQVAQLAGRLPPGGATRLERLRGFGAALGMLATCGCARLDFADGSQGILVLAPAPGGRAMPLVERLQRLVEGIETPIAAFARDGLFVGSSDAARPLLGFRNLSEAGLDQARSSALEQGRFEAPIGIGHLVLQRVGSGADVGLVALVAPHAAAPPQPVAAAIEPAPVRPIPDYEQPAMTGEAPAEFALIDEFAETGGLAEADAHTESSAASGIAARSTEAAPGPDVEPHEPSPLVEAVADEPPVETPPRHEEASAAGPVAAPSWSGAAAPPTAAPDVEAEPDPASPAIETVAEGPPPAEAPHRLEDAGTSPSATEAARAPSWLDEPSPHRRRHPLRFMWQMDAEGRFSLGSDEFTRLIGVRTAAGFGRLWRDIAEAFGLDPEGRILKAVATHDTWGGITLNWPVDGGGRLPVELSGLPIFDRARNFAGYRGFGVCRDLDGLARLAALRRFELFSNPAAPAALSADVAAADAAETPAAGLPAAPDVASSAAPESPAAHAAPISPSTDLETAVETPKNVLPFRPLGEPKPLALTPVENSAFNELARQLSARLDSENGAAATPNGAAAEADAAPATQSGAPATQSGAPATQSGAPGTPGAAPEMPPAASDAGVAPPAAPQSLEPAAAPPDWLARPEAPARGETRRDRALFDLVPVGVLIYRLDRLLYANPAFLQRMGYPSLDVLEQAGGLDALYVEPGVSTASSTSDTGTPVTISATQASSEHAPASPTEARLFTISWDGESALALIFSGAGTDAAAAAAAPATAAAEPSAVGHANAEELGAILDTMAEGVVMFDAEGHINSCNRSAEALFGYGGAEFVQRQLAELFAPESQPAVLDYLEGIKGANVASLLDHGRDVLGRVREGGLIPLSITIGRTQAQGPNFFAVFRDLSQLRQSESELQQARRLADRAASAKADMLARISHEVRTPLNAIIGFAEVMIGERFGALGNERYVEYMKDIRASGQRVIAIINDLLDLSRIETGKLDLSFASQNLNDLVEQCVGVMQPQANRERIIIRTSLAHQLPPVVADAGALRQITLNLIGNSIHLANAGGQVIVSTALSDFGEVVLRVRDTGHGLNDNELAAAMEPFSTQGPSDQASEGSGVSLSLTKALVEANRAQFHIKTGPHSGTLIEVVFAHAAARA